MSPEIGLRGERKEGELGISTRILGKMASYLLEWKEEVKDEVVGVKNYNFYGVALDEKDDLVKPVCHGCLEKKGGSFYYRLIPFEEGSAREMAIDVYPTSEEENRRKRFENHVERRNRATFRYMAVYGGKKRNYSKVNPGCAW